MLTEPDWAIQWNWFWATGRVLHTPSHILDQVLLKRRKRVRLCLCWTDIVQNQQCPHFQGPNQPPYQICDILLSELWVRSFSQPMCSLGKGAFARAHIVFSCRFAPAHKVAASHADLETLPCFESVCRSIATPPRKIYESKTVIQQWSSLLGPWLNRRRCVAVLMKRRASDVLTTTKVWLDGKDSVIFIFNFHFLLLWGFLQFVMIAPLSLMSKMSSSWLSVIIIKMKS